MKKVLIISYYYPPSTFVGGDRISYWVENLHLYGIYPIVITRQWNKNQKDIFENVINNHKTIDKNEKFEIRRMPVKNSIRQSLSKYRFLRLIQKILTVKEILLSNYFIKSLPYSNFYKEARNAIKENNIQTVIVSGRPFQSFIIGYYLKKEFEIFWIPDYRDQWTTYKREESKSIFGNFLYKLDQRSELKWTSNADYFITVSDHWVNRINKYINKEGKVVMNGFHSFKPLRSKLDSNTFKIIYAGTFYVSQPIDLFIDSIKKLQILFDNTKMELELIFIGTEIDVNGHDKLFQLTENIPNVSFKPRMNKTELNDEIERCDLLLLTSFENVKGWYPVKLFDYYATGKPILLIPSDEDVMEEFIKNVGCGYTCNSIKECVDLLKKLLNNKMTGVQPILCYNHEFAQRYSRKNQTKLLAEILNPKEL